MSGLPLRGLVAGLFVCLLAGACGPTGKVRETMRRAEAGSADAMISLAHAYRPRRKVQPTSLSYHVDQDDVVAYMWMTLARDRGDRGERRRAQVWLDDWKRDMSTRQLAKAERLVREWRPNREQEPQSPLGYWFSEAFGF